MAFDSCDVAIVGGGPAGSATAISLRTHAPLLSVVLIEASRYNSFRIGETLPPPARAVLEHLDLWESFASDSHEETYGSTTSWGSASLQHNDYFFSPANVGWHVDRVAFDAMLAQQAASRGTRLLLNTRIHHAQRRDGKWRLILSADKTIDARFIVDATGTAALARGFGSQFIEEDQLIGIARVFAGANRDASTIVEPFAHGWWYTAALPNDLRIVVLMTDSDLARRFHFQKTAEWESVLSDTRHVSVMVNQSKPSASLAIRSASSRRLTPPTGDDWLAVGDSASRFDPLSSQGVFKALRSGVFGAYAIADRLTRSETAGLRKYNYLIEAEFKGYLDVRARYYCDERRWSRSEFWRRRHLDSDPAAGSAMNLKMKLEPAPARDSRLALADRDANRTPLV
ncbi:MAG TPA: NAD(P)/FAD-dependent oxidoreductase [Pyrinomonadaceae bacterium]|jgi:flavin-dependent dehydrogenase|nr:NAD(P)/FAD-dependent oxidoreductase [Pyrinomonadaceae bacterium]